MNIFEQAKKNSKKTTTKKNDKAEIKIKSQQVNEDIHRLVELEESLASIKAEYDMLKSSLKEEAMHPYIKLYEESGKYPGSVRIVAESPKLEPSEFLFVPMDKYIKIDSERAEELVDKYGDEIIEEETTFKFNSALLNKYADVLNKMISECDEIDDEDKKNLIDAEVKISIAKGSIKEAAKLGDVKEVFEDIKPIITMKNPKI